jgi:hypothetical protein
MVKKLVLGTLLVGLIVVLVAGAAIRTLDKTGNVAEARGQGHGGEQSTITGQGQGQGQGHGAGGQGVQSAGGSGYGGTGNTAAPGDGTGTGQAVVDEWLTLAGTVISVDADALVVQTAEGEITVENRPWWFAQESGFGAQVGDQVTLTGFYEDGDPSTGSGQSFEVGQIDDTTSGQTVSIRDENGRPGWAGRGRRSG